MEDVWVEKYRPMSLDDVVGNRPIVDRLKRFRDMRFFPDMLFAGKQGIGKTTCAHALCRDIYGDKYKLGKTVLELNASDDRGVGIVRGIIKDFSKRYIFDKEKVPFLTIILDESDNMTNAAQQALRRTIETTIKNCRFIFCCNISSKIIEPIHSRCTVFRFNPIIDDEMKKGLRKVIEAEDLVVDDKSMKAIIYVSKGDLRKGINLLQGICQYYEGNITDELIYSTSGFIDPDMIKIIINEILDGNFELSCDMANKLINEKGLDPFDIVKQFHREVIKMKDIDEIAKLRIIDRIGEIHYRLINGGTGDIQIHSLLSNIYLSVYETDDIDK